MGQRKTHRLYKGEVNAKALLGTILGAIARRGGDSCLCREEKNRVVVVGSLCEKKW